MSDPLAALTGARLRKMSAVGAMEKQDINYGRYTSLNQEVATARFVEQKAEALKLSLPAWQATENTIEAASSSTQYKGPTVQLSGDFLDAVPATRPAAGVKRVDKGEEPPKVEDLLALRNWHLERETKVDKGKITSLETSCAGLEKLAEERQASIDQLTATVAERDGTIEGRDATISERDDQIGALKDEGEKLQATVTAREATVAELEAAGLAKDAAAGEQAACIESAADAASEAAETVSALEERLKNMESRAVAAEEVLLLMRSSAAKSVAMTAGVDDDTETEMLRVRAEAKADAAALADKMQERKQRQMKVLRDKRAKKKRGKLAAAISDGSAEAAADAALEEGLEAFFDFLDADNSGVVELSELEVMARHIPSLAGVAEGEIKARVDAAWAAKGDADNGAVDLSQFDDVMAELGQSWPVIEECQATPSFVQFQSGHNDSDPGLTARLVSVAQFASADGVVHCEPKGWPLDPNYEAWSFAVRWKQHEEVGEDGDVQQLSSQQNEVAALLQPLLDVCDGWLCLVNDCECAKGVHLSGKRTSDSGAKLQGPNVAQLKARFEEKWDADGENIVEGGKDWLDGANKLLKEAGMGGYTFSRGVYAKMAEEGNENENEISIGLFKTGAAAGAPPAVGDIFGLEEDLDPSAVCTGETYTGELDF